MDDCICHSVIAFCFAAIAADDSLPRNIELKPGGAPADAAGQTAEDTGSGTTTRQIVTEPASRARSQGRCSAPSPAARGGTAW
jgi:hypothetical protein